MDDAAADRKCEYVALLSSGSIVIGSHCLLPFGMKRLAWGSRSRVPLHGFGAPPPRTFWCAAAAYMLAAMPITAQAERLPLDRDLWREG
jgi:hypothetical protein